jgi:hypoxanthine phosphoribosyltransferase
MELKPGRTILTEREIAERVTEMAREINAHYSGAPVTIIGILDSCIIFLADLVRRFEMPLDVTLIKVKTYGDGDGPRNAPSVPADELSRIRGRNVLVIDDIYDTGATLSEVSRELTAAGAADVRLCVFLEKDRPHEHESGIDFCGFVVPNVFVVGYGLDYAGLWRNLPHLAELDGRDEGPAVV